MRYAARKDVNHRLIVKALEAVGCSVVPLDQTDIPDLLVGYRRITHLLEVKRPLGARGGSSHSKLSPGQTRFRDTWRGRPVCVVRSVTEAFAAIGFVASAQQIAAIETSLAHLCGG